MENNNEELKTKNYFNLPVAMVVSSLILGGAWIYTQKPASEGNMAGLLNPPHVQDGITLPVKWDDLGAKMISVGVIDAEKFESLYASRGGLDENVRRLLYEENNDNLKITAENSGFGRRNADQSFRIRVNRRLDIGKRACDGTLRKAPFCDS